MAKKSKSPHKIGPRSGFWWQQPDEALAKTGRHWVHFELLTGKVYERNYKYFPRNHQETKPMIINGAIFIPPKTKFVRLSNC